MKFFNIDAHISVISDIKKIFEDLGHEVDNLSISGHTWVFNKDQDHPEIINSVNWKNIDNDMCDKFYDHYKYKLDKYDAFICTHTPVFSQLFEKFKKPILTIASTRYEYPYTFDKNKWLNFNSYLTNKNVVKLTNNLFDKHYCELFTDVEWKYIPSLCEYTNSKYNRTYKESILFSKTKKINFLKNKEELGRYSWDHLYQYSSIVHIPYNYSTMSMFEQYTANVPLLIPDKKYLTELFLEKEAMSEISFRQVLNKEPNTILGIYNDPNIYNNINIFLENLDYCDFYNKEWMPDIEYFSSLEDLKQKLSNLNYQNISDRMCKTNIFRKEKIYFFWKGILNELQ